MNATASPLLQPLCDSLTTIARGADARALRAHLQGHGLPIVGGDTEPTELILRALGETPDAPRLAADLATPLARVIAECVAELRAEDLTPTLRLLFHQALRLAADLPANAALAEGLRALAASLEEVAPDFWHQAPLAPLVARALVYQQTDTQSEPLWLRLLENSGEGPWTPERRTVLLSAWRGLLHVPPDEEASRVGRVINIDRIERGLLALEAGVRSRDGGPRLVRQAMRLLAETFPRSPKFWEQRLASRLASWPAGLREVAAQQWPSLEQGTISYAEAMLLSEEQEKRLKVLLDEKEAELAALQAAIQHRDAQLEELGRRLQEMAADREKLRGDYVRLRLEAQEKIDKLMERIKELNQRFVSSGRAAAG